MTYMYPSIPITPPQPPRCEGCGKPCRESPLCRRCRAAQDTHRRRIDLWTRALR